MFSSLRLGMGLEKDTLPIRYGIPPTIPIQQPSKADLAVLDEEIGDEREYALKGYPSIIHYRRTVQYR
jgi:hypothetical protein